MTEANKTTASEKIIVANKQYSNKTVTHFNWFARFENSQTEKYTVLKP
ncbi:hypothetical protein [Paraglaciecola hydrolytica]|nr:hypothetical protein [Paraglaciecola hydrolytica]